MFSSLLPFAAAEPAGGAELTQIVIATAGATFFTAVLLWLVMGHRSGRVTVLGRIAAFAETVTPLPGFAALPVALSGGSLLVAFFGMYWDISLHIDQGRDAGPLANPAHYFILFGLFGTFAAGLIAVAFSVGDERPGPASVRIADGFHAPVGGLLILAAGAFSLTGFPLDDVWHRLFGQDVTLWGPTHLMLIGGAGLTLIGQSVLLTEGRWHRRDQMRRAGIEREPAPSHRSPLTVLSSDAVRRVGLMGGLLIGLCTFQGEFDFGIPQFRIVLHPFLIAAAGGLALVAARVWIGRGGALGAALFFVVLKGIIAVLVGPVLGETTPIGPLYIVEALCVEAAAMLLLKRNPYAFAALAAVGISTIGFAAEYAWSQLVWELPWTPGMIVEGVITATIGALAGATIGLLFALALQGRLPRPGLARIGVVGAVVAVFACVGNGLLYQSPSNGRVDATVSEVSRGADGVRMVDVTLRVTPAELADSADVKNVTAWQGKAKLEVAELERVGPGLLRTSRPVPVGGEDWKTIVRLQDGRAIVGAALYLPLDEAIPAPEVPASAAFSRPLIRDTKILQREKKTDVPVWLATAGTLTVLFISCLFWTALAIGSGRVGRALAKDPLGSDVPGSPAGALPRELATSAS